MTRKELNEIKSQYTLEDCGILRLCGCYVDGERNKITQFNENFLIFRKRRSINILIYLRRLFQEHQERIWLI